MNYRDLSPNAIKPMLVAPAKQPPAGDQWVHEIKYDGYRMLCRVSKGTPAFISRHGRDWTSSLPCLARSIQELGLNDAVLDGELVYFADDGRTDFDELKRRLRKKSTDLSYVAFDLLRFDGRDMTRLPLVERKEILSSLLAGAGFCISFSEHLHENGTLVFEHARRLGLEGIVSKKVDSLYFPGQRSKDWLKTKNGFEEDFLVCGVIESKDEIEALHLGKVNDGVLSYAGKVELGLWRGVQEDIRKRTKRSNACPFGWPISRRYHVTWVMPEVAVKVRFTSWSSKGRIREGRVVSV